MTAILDADLNVIARDVDPNIFLTQHYYNEGKWDEYIDRPTYEIDMFDPRVIIIKPTYEYLAIIRAACPTRLRESQFNQGLISHMKDIQSGLLRQLYRNKFPNNSYPTILVRYGDEYFGTQSVIQLRKYSESELHENELAIQDSIEAMLLYSYRMNEVVKITTKSGLSRQCLVRDFRDSIVTVDMYNNHDIVGRASIRKDFISMIMVPIFVNYDIWLMHISTPQ